MFNVPKKDRLPGFRVGVADDVPGFRLNQDGSIRQSPIEDEAIPAAHRPRVLLPKMEGNPGPSLHPPGRWRQFAPGFPWEWYPDPPVLPPPPGPPHFQPRQYQPLPNEPWPPEPRPETGRPAMASISGVISKTSGMSRASAVPGGAV